jgi:hypothetical protein
MSTKSWHMENSIFHVDINNQERKQELLDAGFHRLDESETDPADMTNLKRGSFVVIGRQELVTGRWNQEKQEHDQRSGIVLGTPAATKGRRKSVHRVSVHGGLYLKRNATEIGLSLDYSQK